MRLRNAVVTFLFLFGILQTCSGQERVIDDSCGIPFESKLFNELETPGRKFVGDMFLLLEPRYFNAQHLKTLFQCLSQKNPKFVSLWITAFSDEENLKIAVRNYLNPPKETGAASAAAAVDCKNLAQAAGPCPAGYYRAVFYRDRTEQFSYSPDPNKKNMVTVVLRKKL